MGSKITIVLSIIINIFIAFNGIFIENTGFKYVFILPIVFIFTSIVSYLRINILSKYFVFWILYIQAFIRMSLLPYIVMNGEKTFFSTDIFYSDLTTFMFIIENIIMAVLFMNVKSKTKEDKINFTENKKLYNCVFVVLIILLIFILTDEAFLKKVNFIWNFGDYFKNVLEGEEDDSSSLSNFFFPIVRTICVAIIILKISKSKVSKTKKIIFSSVIVLFNSSIIVGSSRFSIIYASIPLVLLLLHIFPYYKKIIVNFSLSLSILVIAISSLTKYSTHKQVTLDSFVSALQLNAYFTGIFNYSKGLESYNNKNVLLTERPSYLISDVFKNIPFFSKLSDEHYQTSTLFNNEIYGSYRNQDQIVPISISGLYHFSYAFFYIHFIYLIYLSFYWERVAYKQKDILLFICYVTIAFSCSTLMMVNIGSIYKTIFTFFIILVPLFKFLKTVFYEKNLGYK